MKAIYCSEEFWFSFPVFPSLCFWLIWGFSIWAWRAFAWCRTPIRMCTLTAGMTSSHIHGLYVVLKASVHWEDTSLDSQTGNRDPSGCLCVAVSVLLRAECVGKEGETICVWRIMYVLCTLVLLTLQNLLKRLELGEPGANEGPEQSSDEAVQPGQGQRAKPPWHGGSAPTQGGISQSPCGCVIHHCSESHQHEQRSESPHYGKGNVPTSSKKVQVSERECRVLSDSTEEHKKLDGRCTDRYRVMDLVVESTSH